MSCGQRQGAGRNYVQPNVINLSPQPYLEQATPGFERSSAATHFRFCSPQLEAGQRTGDIEQQGLFAATVAEVRGHPGIVLEVLAHAAVEYQAHLRVLEIPSFNTSPEQ